MHPVHYDVARPQAIDDLRQVGRNVLSVHIDHQRRFFRVVETLADAEAEEGGIVLHHVVSDLLLNGYGLVEAYRRQS